MTRGYQPREYWDARLGADFSLSGVGYQGYSRRYNAWLYRSEARALARLLAAAGEHVEGRSVVDVGSGTGFWLGWFVERGAGRVAGVEFSPSAAARLRSNFPSVAIVEADITGALPAIAPADLVNVQSVLYHIVEPAEFHCALENLAGLVRPGGRLILSDRLGERDVRPDEHVQFRALATIESALAALGLRIERVEPVHTLLNGGLQSLAGRGRLARMVRLVEELFAPLLYALDGTVASRRRANKRMLIARA